MFYWRLPLANGPSDVLIDSKSLSPIIVPLRSIITMNRNVFVAEPSQEIMQDNPSMLMFGIINLRPIKQLGQ